MGHTLAQTDQLSNLEEYKSGLDLIKDVRGIDNYLALVYTLLPGYRPEEVLLQAEAFLHQYAEALVAREAFAQTNHTDLPPSLGQEYKKLAASDISGLVDIIKYDVVQRFRVCLESLTDDEFDPYPNIYKLLNELEQKFQEPSNWQEIISLRFDMHLSRSVDALHGKPIPKLPYQSPNYTQYLLSVAQKFLIVE